MGCCQSQENTSMIVKKKERTTTKWKRFWLFGWKRIRITERLPSPPKSSQEADYVPRYAGYEKTQTTQTASVSMSSRMGDAPLFVALWNYDARTKAELPIKVGDKLRQMGDPGEITDPDWMFVMREEVSDQQTTGYVPKAYLAPIGSLESNPYYFGVCSGPQAEQYLSKSSSGAYLVRKRAEFVLGKKSSVRKAQGKSVVLIGGKQANAEYALSLKTRAGFAHLPIYHDPERIGGGYFLTPKLQFASVKDLVTYYESKETPDPEVPCQLLQSPKKTPPKLADLSVAAQKTWREIPRSQIVLGEIIGKGHFGVVYKGVWNTPEKTAIPVAVKALKKDTVRTRRKFLKEAVTMRSLVHDHLVQLYGIVSSEGATNQCWIVTEYVKDGSLRLYLTLKRCANTKLGEQTLVKVCAQIADGMQYLESKRVVHRDLAARNVLVIELEAGVARGKDPVLHVKVADFGLAHVTVESPKTAKGSNAPSAKAGGTVPTKWTAPEALLENKYSSASDVWSFGVVIHEVFTHGLEPYGILQHQAVRDYVCKKRQILGRHKDVPEKAYEMMKRCFKYEPDERPPFMEIFTFFDSYYKKPGQTSLTGC